MTQEEKDELFRLDLSERTGLVLTGAERGRLADLRRAEIIEAIKVEIHLDSRKIADVVIDALPKANPVMDEREVR